MFSTSTMASSTSSPTAIAMPPSVIVLMVMLKALKTIAVTRTDKGMAVSVMKLVRRFQRKRNRMSSTHMVPSRIASTTLSTAA